MAHSSLNLARRLAPLTAVLAVAVVPMVLGDHWLGSLVFVGIYAIALLGLDLVKGYAGLLSLGQAGFMGIAAYTTGILTTRYHWGAMAALGAAIVIVLAIALIMAIPGSRLTGFNLALATLGFGMIMEGLFYGVRDLTGGASGIVGIPRLELFGFKFRTEADSFMLVWGVLLLAFWISYNIVNSRVGRSLRAIKQHELAASTLGINVAQEKIKVFLVASVYSAVAGSLYAHYTRFISPDMVGWSVSTGLVSMLVLGGEGSLWGVVLGALVLKLLPEIFNGIQDYLMMLQGLILIVLMARLPDGLAGAFRTFFAWLMAGRGGARPVGKEGAL